MDRRIIEKEKIPSGIRIIEVGGGGQSIVAKTRELSEYNIAEAICEDEYDFIQKIDCQDINLVVIIVCLGGYNGFKAASVVVNYAKALNVPIICLVTIPFRFEGDKKIERATRNVGELTAIADQIIVLNNQLLVEHYGELPIAESFTKVDKIIAKNIDRVIGDLF